MFLSKRKSCCAVAVRDVLAFVEAKCFLSTDKLSYGELSAPIGGNVLRIREVRLSKLPVSICTNVYLLILMYQFLLYENNILRSRQLKSKKTSSSPAFFLCAVRGS